MAVQTIHAWLRRRALLHCGTRLTAAAGLLALAAGILFVEYWLVVGFCYFVLYRLGVPPTLYPVFAWTFLVLLFIGNARTDRRYLTEFSYTTGTFSNEVVHFYLPGVGMVSNINPLAPDSAHSLVKMITLVLYTGPRAAVAAVRCLGAAVRLALLDRAACAAVIECLYRHPGRVDFAAIVCGIPGLNPVKVFPQVALIEGVLALKSEPAGLMLGSDLREDLNRLLG